MREFFRGWRGKLGVVTLLMACVCMGLLIRGETYHDSLSIKCGSHTTADIDSVHGYLLFDSQTTVEKASSHVLNWHSLLSCDRSLCLYYLDKSVGWRFQCFAIGIYKIEGHNKGADRRVAFVRRTLFVSCWSIVIPLTLLSGFLLLSKPRKWAEKKNAELPPDEGA